MWKDPQKAAAQQVSETSSGPSFAAPSRTNLPPPTRRGGSGGNAAPVQLEEAISAEGQAQVVYDYEGGVSPPQAELVLVTRPDTTAYTGLVAGCR